MKQVSELKKGDVVTIIYGYVGREDPRNKPETVVVDSVGRKYIKVKYLFDDGHISERVWNFDIETLSDKEWSYRHLFLGTVEELAEAREQASKSKELTDHILGRLSKRDIPYEKLKAIKGIIDSE